MCEWLSCEEWCDVFLLCGGRVFSAHRAVLASVSKFLRKLLLSCPVDETPTFIIIPEFDLETMSSALHYIYKGEVVIERRQLDTFLDIMNALQVFVDTRQLIEDEDSLEKKNTSIDHKEDIIMTQNTPVPLVGEDIITIEKDIKFKAELRSDNVNVLKTKQDYNNYKSINIWSGYLKSLEDRQRQQFSSDLFIETYSLNRNSNGGAEGVLAISNEHYREPTSALLENANVDLSRLSNTSHKMDSENILRSLDNDKQTLKSCNKASAKIMCDKSSQSNTHDSIRIHSINDSLISRNTNHTCFNSDSNNLEEQKLSVSENGNDLSKSKQTTTRVTILNEVLQSPWRPQLPNTFTPSPKKTINLSKLQKSETLQIKKKDSTNDRNNNSNKFENLQNNTVSNEMELKKTKRDICKEVFPDIKVDMREHSSTRYTCTECQKTFSQLRNYKYHMSVHRGTKEFATTCPVCGKFFNDKGYLSSHMKIHRNRKEYKCSLCPKSFNQRVAYNMHVRIHTGVKPHVCEECGKAFSRKMLLKQHQRTHSGERPYACPHCNKRFADRSNMTLHLRLHSGVKPFTCSLCPKSFTKKHHLKSHLNFHTGDKPYVCPRCKLAFTQSSNMRTHMKKCNVEGNI